jgi:uncharacterized protein YjcR
MAKKKKVKSRASTKYTTSSDEGSSSDDEDDLLTLFANLNMQQKEKLNELIGAIHEKDELLDSQEEFLIKENKKHVKVKNAYAQEIEKCCRYQVDIPQQARRAWCGDKEQSPTCGQGLFTSRRFGFR